MKNLFALGAACAILAWGLTGCETTKGAGEDISNTGENIQQGINASTSNDTNATDSSGLGAGLDNMNNTSSDGGNY